MKQSIHSNVLQRSQNYSSTKIVISIIIVIISTLQNYKFDELS